MPYRTFLDFNTESISSVEVMPVGIVFIASFAAFNTPWDTSRKASDVLIFVIVVNSPLLWVKVAIIGFISMFETLVMMVI